MRFFRLLFAEAGSARFKLALSIAASGLGTAAIMTVVNSVADRKDISQFDGEMFVFFLLCAFTVISTQAYSQRLTAEINERILHRLRSRMTHLVRRTELDALEGVGTARIYDAVARETTTVSEASGVIVHGAGSFIAMVLAGFYMLMLSTLAFVVLAVLFTCTIYLYQRSQRTARETLVRAAATEGRFFELLHHLLDGFKEVKLNSRRGDDLEMNHLADISALTRAEKINAVGVFNRGLTISYTSFYILLAASIFALPQYLDSTQTAMKLIYVVIFILATQEVVMKALPSMARANLAVDKLDELERVLSNIARDSEPSGAAEPDRFEAIEMRGVVYTHMAPDGQAAFRLGPSDFSIRPGEIVFVVGGNGSGKSTFLRLLTRLYEPRSGTILWDGRLVEKDNAPAYRNLFSAVFADFHLFDRLYGMTEEELGRVPELLERVGLAAKTQFVDGRFTTLDLSTGQRKRLALVVAMLEDRPIYVLDELAADQDQEFRARFYGEFLPELKRRGRAVVAVSHDERYFHCADRVLTMEDGHFTNNDGTA